MKRTVMKGFVGVLAAAFAFCAWHYYKDVYTPNHQIIEADRTQRELFGRIKPPPENFVHPVDDTAPEITALKEDPEKDPLAVLREENEDAVGWITIDGTNIDYPIVQSKDNSHYLQIGFDGKYNYGLGCPFLDYRCDSSFGGFDSIVYAHHIRGNQAMFADIAKYRSSSFMREHPEGKLLTEDGVHDVRFFAYMTVPSSAFVYKAEFADDSSKEEYIDNIFSGANYTLDMKAEDLKACDDLRLLLLSTCTYEYWEARGVLVGVIE